MSTTTTPRLNLPIPGGTVYDARLGDIDAVLAALTQLDGIIYGIQQELAVRPPTGPTGPAGAQGVPGIQGQQGPTGVAGPTGATGADGVGITGPAGPTGPRGLQGIDGPAGPAGPTGAQGPAGPAGTGGTLDLTSTDDLPEGTTNKYYTATRARADVGTLTLAMSGDVTATSTALTNGTIGTTLAASGVVPGYYPTASITVDAKGRVTSATGDTMSLSNVYLSTSLNGANGDTGFTDFVGNILTPDANAVISTTTYTNGSLTGGIVSSPTASSGNGLILGTANFTIEAWVNVTGLGNSDSTFLSGPNWAFTGGNALYNGNGWLSIPSRGDDQWGGSTVGFGALNGTGWKHVAVVRNGTTLTSYVNGVLVDTFTGFTGTLEQSAAATTIDMGFPSGSGNGYVRGVRISRYARYLANFTPYTDLTATSFITSKQKMQFVGDVTSPSTYLTNGGMTLTLPNTGVTAGTYGSATHTPQFAVDSKGRITGASNIASTPPTTTYTGDVTGSGTGTIGLTLANSGVTAGAYGDATHVAQIQVDAKGRVTAASSAAISISTTTTQAWGNATTSVASTAFVDRLRDVPQGVVGAYTLALTDRGTCLEASGNITIPANATVAFPIGSVIQVLNTSASPITISVTTDTMKLIGTASTGTRTLAANGLATLMKRVNTTTWYATGVGLS